jgi:Fe-S-cluster containining protein
MTPKPRSCGTCSACCTRPSVEEIGKPENTDCQFHDGRRCTRYETRPSACREFGCLWLSGSLPKEHRPDRLGIVFSASTSYIQDLAVVDAWEMRAHAAEEGEGFGVLRTIAKQYTTLVHYVGGESRVMGEPNDVRRLQAALLTKR